MACENCGQSKYVDSLTGRCITCEPIQIGELPPDFQPYFRKAHSQRYREFSVLLFFGPVSIAILLFYEFAGDDAPAWIFLVLLAATPVLIGVGLYRFILKRNLLLRYYRLAYAMQHVTPVQAELQYAPRRSGHHVKVCQLAPGSKWPDGVGQKVEIDFPPKSDIQAVTNDRWKTLLAGYDPNDQPKLWGQIYFDPDLSGSAVVCIKDRVFLSVSENNSSV